MIPWGKVYADLHSNPKWARVTPAARGLWITALSWCLDCAPTGTIPAVMLPALGGDAALAEELRIAGLWDAHPDGYRFHDWDEHQAQLPSRRAARRREAARKAARARWDRHQPVDNPPAGPVENMRAGCDSDAIGMRSACDPDADGMRTVCDRDATASENPRDNAANQCEPDARAMRTACAAMPRDEDRDRDNPPTPLEGGESGFEAFFSTYPRPVNRPAALRAWRAAARTYTATGIVAAAAAYRDDPNLPPERYIPAPHKWLRAEAWNDLPLPARSETTAPQRAGPTVPTLAQYEREAAALRGINPNDPIAYLHTIRETRKTS